MIFINEINVLFLRIFALQRVLPDGHGGRGPSAEVLRRGKRCRALEPEGKTSRRGLNLGLNREGEAQGRKAPGRWTQKRPPSCRARVLHGCQRQLQPNAWRMPVGGC